MACLLWEEGEGSREVSKRSLSWLVCAKSSCWAVDVESGGGSAAVISRVVARRTLELFSKDICLSGGE